jgi:hypothetical protein
MVVHTELQIDSKPMLSKSNTQREDKAARSSDYDAHRCSWEEKRGIFDVETAISSALISEEAEQDGSAVTFRALNFSSEVSRNLHFWDHTNCHGVTYISQ